MAMLLRIVRCVTLALVLAVWLTGCSGSDSTSSNAVVDGNGFQLITSKTRLQERVNHLKALLPQETFNKIFAATQNDPQCREANRAQLGLPEEPNGQWYYTYENVIRAMAEWDKFAAEPKDDANIQKLEIAAFLANIAQETGNQKGDFGGPGCAIQEGFGSAWHSCNFGGCNTDPNCQGTCPDGSGYPGRGPHQLTYRENYRAYGQSAGVGDAYVKDPDQLTQDPLVGIGGSIWFWGHEERTSSSPPDIPFKPSAHNVVVGNWKATQKDITCGRTVANFGVVINLINGGVECCKCVYDQVDKKNECCVRDCTTCMDPWGADPDGGECKVWSCCESIDCVNEACRAPDERAANRVKYLRAIAKEMGVTLPDGFDVDCGGQLNFANCASY